MAARRAALSTKRGIDDGGLRRFQLQPVIFELAADLGQQIVVDAAFHQRVAEAAMGGLVGHRGMQAQPAKQHEIEPHLQRAFQLRVRQPVPLADQQALFPLIHQRKRRHRRDAFRLWGAPSMMGVERRRSSLLFWQPETASIRANFSDEGSHPAVERGPHGIGDTGSAGPKAFAASAAG
jgi:hypothetical protein